MITELPVLIPGEGEPPAGLGSDHPMRKVTRAVAFAMEDAAALPIFFWKGSWGLRRGLTMTPRGDQYTYASDIRPAN